MPFPFLEREARLPLELDRLLAEGREWKAAGDYRLAEIYFREAVRLARHRSDPELTGDASLQLAGTLMLLSRHRQAASVFRSLFHVPMSPRLTSQWNSLIALLSMHFGRFDLADVYCRRALDLPRDEVGEFQVGAARGMYASVLGMQGHFESARDEFSAAQRIFERIEGDGGLALALMLGNEVDVHLWRGDVDRAVHGLERIQALPAFSGNPALSAKTYSRLAEAALLTGDVDLARVLDEQAETSAGQSGRASVEADVVLHRAVMRQDDPAPQIARLEEMARRLCLKGNLLNSAWLWSLAAVLAERGGLPAELYQEHARRLASGADALISTHCARLFESSRRPRPGRLGVRWRIEGPALDPSVSDRESDEAGESPLRDLGIAIFASETALESLVRKPLWDLGRLQTFDDWVEFERAALSAGLAVVVLPSAAGENDRARFFALKTRAPFLPVVLVTGRNADGALEGLPFDEVVRLGEVERTLREVALSLASRALLPRLALMLSRADRLPAKLREALAYACRTRSPVRSVSALAGTVGRHRTTLGRMWRRAVGDTGIRLEDFLDWLLLLRAVGRRPRGMSWAAVAAELDVPEQTLRETSRRLLGRRLDQLSDVAGQAWLVERFVRRILNPLLDVPRINSR